MKYTTKWWADGEVAERVLCAEEKAMCGRDLGG